MTALPFAINVVSRSHAVVCGTCGTSAQQVAANCSACGSSFAAGGFAIVATSADERRRMRGRLKLRRVTAA